MDPTTPRRLRRAAPLLFALPLLAALPSSAGAVARDITYSVDVRLEGRYVYQERADYGEGFWRGQETTIGFEATGRLAEVVFRSGSPYRTAEQDIGDGVAGGTYVLTGSDGSRTCRVYPDEDPTQGTMRIADEVEVTDDLQSLDGETRIWLRPFDRYRISVACPDGTNPAVELTVPDGSERHLPDGTIWPGQHPFDIRFGLPHETAGMGYVEQLIPEQRREGAACPGWSEGFSQRCELTWTAKVQFRKRWARARVVPARARLERRARRIVLDLRCGGGCRGEATVQAGTRGSGPVLARTRYRVADGRTATVTVALRPRARRAVTAAGAARLTLTTTATGEREPERRTLALRPPR